MTTLLDLLFQKSSAMIFDSQSGTLNLSGFCESPDLVSVQHSVDFNSVAFCKSLVNVIKNKIGTSLRILALNNNNIRKLTVLLAAMEEADVHNGITAISATGNQISDFGLLGPLKKYANLGELLLEGNPLTKRDDYRTQVIKSLPKLMMLDGQLIDRALLRLPNPVPATLNDAQVGVLRFIEGNVFQTATSRNYDALMNLYNPGAVCSVSRAEEPIPRNLPFDATHNCQKLTPQQRNVLGNDFVTLRKLVQWRNILTDVHSLRHVSTGRAKASLLLQALGGGEKKFISVSHELNENANVVFLSQNMKIPTCVLTIHGKMFWHWSPKNANGDDLYPRHEAPFFTCFFDRTMTLLLNTATNVWTIQNDMIFMRPDRTTVNEKGFATPPLFFANEATRVEKMRRRYLPKATPEVMRAIIEQLGSDQDLQAFIMGHLATLPGDLVERALTDSSVLATLFKR